MQTIALEQLDPSASQWLRQASLNEPIVVTEQGTPILTVTITPAPNTAAGDGLARRVLRPGFAKLMNKPIGGTGITEILEQDREDRW
jgi:antitoxin (DNA-binding transcriptional repressor) of toxin-antitoxin stability system